MLAITTVEVFIEKAIAHLKTIEIEYFLILIMKRTNNKLSLNNAIKKLTF